MRSEEVGLDPESGEELEKILIELPPENWSGQGGERVWAKPLGDDQYEIRNTPWYAYDVNWGDVVQCEGMSPANLPIVAGIVRPGGHRTLRLIFEDGIDEADRQRILDDINRLEATYENADGRMYAVDVEPGVDVRRVLDYLAVQEEHALLNWETGWS